MNYFAAQTRVKSFRCPTKGKLIANNTRLYQRDNGDIALCLHKTDVVVWCNDGRVILNSGGWHTVTTKQRINSVLHKLGYTLYQKKHVWYVAKHGQWDNAQVYFDGYTIRQEELAS